LALTAAPIGMLVVEVAAFAALACVLLVTLWRRRAYVERVVAARTETLEREAADRTRATETLRRNEQQQKEVARALR